MSDQPNSYGLNEADISTPTGKSYDGQVIGTYEDGSPRTKGTLRAIPISETGHKVITAVHDPRYMTPKSMADLQPSDVVTIAGVGQMELRSAIQAGLVDANSLSGAAHAQPQAPVVQPQAPVKEPESNQNDTEARPDRPSEETLQGDHAGAEAVIDTFAQKAPDDLKLSLVEQAASLDIGDDLLNQAATVVGSREQVDAVRAGLEAQAKQAVSDATGLTGDDLQSFIDGLYAEHGAELGRAVRDQLLSRSTAGYRRLAAQVAAANTEWDGAPTCGEGVSARRGPNGAVLVTVGGQDYALADAVALGLVTVSRNKA